MKGKRIDHTASYQVTGVDGISRPLHVFTSTMDAGSRGDLHGELAGIETLTIEIRGRMEGVMRIEKGVYQTLWGETLRSDDPEAP